MEVIVIASAVFGLVASSIFFLVAPRRETGEDLVRRRMNAVEKRAGEPSLGRSQGATSFWEQITQFFLGNKQPGGASYSKLRRLLYQAGYSADNAVQVFWGVRFVLMAALGAIVAVLQLTSGAPLMTLLFYVALGVLAGFMGPQFYLQRRASQRNRQLQEALPDTLDLLVVCTEAGMGLDAAFVRVGFEQASAGFALGEEFQLMTREVQAGVARREAISRLSERLNIDEFRSLASFLIQTEEFGGSVARSLRVFASQMRQKRSQKAEELARKAVIKLIFPVVLFILPALFLVALAPVAVSIMTGLME